jgi:hypothetical protein
VHLRYLEALASGFDPSDGSELPERSVFSQPGVIRALFHVLREVDAGDPSALAPGDEKVPLSQVLGAATVYDSAEEATAIELGVACSGRSPRFRKPVWLRVPDPDVRCPVCARGLAAFRSPYRTTSGSTYFYWALACRSCAQLFEPAELSAADRRTVYRSSTLRPSIVFDEEKGE